MTLREEESKTSVRHVHALFLGRLQRLRHLDEDARLDPDIGQELDALGTQHAAAIQGLIPFGPQTGLILPRECGHPTWSRTAPEG